jgi:hypothetical protein
MITPYYKPGGKNSEGEQETPHLTDFFNEKVFFEIRCAACNYGLCKHMTILKTPRRRQNLILVEPCPNCLAGGALVKINSEYQEK